MREVRRIILGFIFLSFGSGSDQFAVTASCWALPGDENLLAHALFAEAGETPADMGAIAWSIVNRIGHSRYPDTLYGVITDPGQFAFAPTKKDGNWSDQWNQANNPEALTGRATTAWQRATAMAQAVLSGSTPDPTGGATHYFASRTFDGTPGSAPGDFPRMLRNNSLDPSPYQSPYPERPRPAPPTNFFFSLKPESEWHSNRRRRH